MSVLAANKQNDICNGGDLAALTAAVEQAYYVRQSIQLITAAMEQTWYNNRYGYSRQRWSKLGTTIETVTHGGDGANLRLPKVKRVIRNSE